MARQLTRKAENLFKHKKYKTVTIAEWTRRAIFHRRGLEGTYLKKAAREIDRSSKTVLDDAKIPRRTAGVTGILLDD